MATVTAPNLSKTHELHFLTGKTNSKRNVLRNKNPSFLLLITATNLAFIGEFGEAFCGKGVNGDLYLPPTSIPIFLTLK